ncbi:MAG: sulfatase [Myxococcales bacterium]|nr:sulfatase [Myxococcales bacterium]
MLATRDVDRRRLVLAVLLLTACGSKKQPRDDAAAGSAAPPATDARAGSGSAGTGSGSAAQVAPTSIVPPRPEHAAWNLVDNRHLAHRIVNGDLVLDASTVAFARYTRFGVPAPRWHFGQVIDGTRAAVADKLAALEIPLTVEQARTTVQLTARIHAPDDVRRLEIKVNGRKASKASRVELAPGWQTVSVPIDPGRLAVGENLVMLETTSTGRGTKTAKSDRPPGLAFAWLRLGDAGPIHDLDPRSAVTFDPKPTRGTIELAKDAALTWFVTIPEGAHLVAGVAGSCRVDVRARPSADAFAGGMLAGPEGRVDLTSMGGRVVALSLTAVDCPRTTITAPRITLHGPEPTPLPKAAPPRYVVLWIMDALRADKIPAFTPGARARTPAFDELAKTSVVFRQFYVQGNESQTSHSTIWSGLYPAVHNVRMAGVGGMWKLDHRYDVIATKLAEAGLYTTGVTGNGFVNANGGYARGFKEFRNMMREKGDGTVINGIIYGEKIVDAALGQLDARRADPTYLFLGTIDTHGPWIARKPWIDLYSPARYTGPFQEFGTAKDLGFRPGEMGCSIIPPAEDVERLRAIYDSAISYQDKQLGRLVDQLKSWGIWDQTLLMITADHGEEFFEESRCGHGGSLRDSLVRVPLLVHDPSRFPGGTIVEEGAEAVDILPTMIDVVGGTPADAVQGMSLAPLAQGQGKGWPRPSYASQYEYAHAMRIGRWKIRVGKSGMPVIGDLVDDPGETVDAARSKPVERRMLTDHLGLFLALRAQWKKAGWGVVTNVTPAGAAALDEATTP